MAATKNKRKKKSKRSDHLTITRPKHTSKDLLRAVVISGAVVALVAGLFFVEIGGKSIVGHLTGGNEKSSENASPQMDRYTKSETEALDKLIEDKSK